MPIPLDGVVHANFVGLFAQQTVMTGGFFQSRTAGGSLDTLAAALFALLTPSVLPALSVEVSLTEIVVSDVRRDGDATLHYSVGAPAPGLVTGDALPTQCTVLTRLSTGFKNARRRGRTFFPGLAEGNTQFSHLTGTQLTAVRGYHTALLNTFGPNGTNTAWRWVVYSPENLIATPPRPGTLITPVTATATDTLVRTLHRRQIGVGI